MSKQYDEYLERRSRVDPDNHRRSSPFEPPLGSDRPKPRFSRMTADERRAHSAGQVEEVAEEAPAPTPAVETLPDDDELIVDAE